MAENSQSRTARRKQKRKQKKTTKKPIWKKVGIGLLLAFLLLGVGGAAVGAYWIATAPDLDPAKLEDTFSSTLYDKYGEEFAKLSGEEKREKISFEELPQILIDAVVATEDARFFEHSGIDLRRLGGAVLANISDGFGSQGASTITHQVVEKSFLPPDKKISLKVQEQWLALQLERQYSKEEIMEFYLNKIFYGNRSYGVSQAAQNYFGKSDLNDLTLAEAAILAGLPQRPTAYNPFENPDLTKDRMNTVLTLMVRHGKITQEQADEAREVDIPSLLVESRPDTTPYEAFIQQVSKEVEDKVEGVNIATDGLKVYTTIDPSVQEHVEFLLTDSAENPITFPNDQTQAAMVVLDTKNGAIQAIGGSRNNENVQGFNYAIRDGSQLGSTAKPIMSFGPAIEYNKVSTYHQINDDAPYGDPPIRNWNRSHGGWMTARHAMNQSLNVPTVKLLDEVGIAKAQEFAEGLGIKFANDNMNIRDAIGGTETNVTPLQLAGAYHAFGNQGIYTEPYAVTKVEFPDGRVIDLTPEATVAMSDYTAYMVTDMLKTVVTNGTGTRASVPGVPVAGKTGTTNENRDAWFAGYSTNYTIAAWTGGYTEDGKGRASLTDTRIAQALFKNTMQKISEGIETADFVKPDSVVEVTVEKGSNPPALPSSYTPSSNKVTELFVRGTEPTQTSEKFDQLDPVSGLTAVFDEESNSIQIEWNYDSNDDITFEVSASVDGGQMQNLSSTEETSMEITEVEPGAIYEIQVVAVSGSMRSDPSTTTVTIQGEEEEEESIPAVTGLSAQYIAASSIIDVNWSYDGPDASFEVSVNGQTQTVESNGIEISGAAPGQSYTINVTPIGANDIRGETQSTSVNVPAAEEPSEDEVEEPIADEPADEEEESEEDEAEEEAEQESEEAVEDESEEETEE